MRKFWRAIRWRKELRKFIDQQFLSANAAVTNVSPAGILNGADTDAASGTDATAVIHDMRQILAHYQVNNIPTDSLAVIMQPVLASSIASIYTTLGVPYFPNISGTGGNVLGLQVITSNNVPSGYIISMHPPSVAVADEGGLQIDASREASVELDDNRDLEQLPLAVGLPITTWSLCGPSVTSHGRACAQRACSI